MDNKWEKHRAEAQARAEKITRELHAQHTFVEGYMTAWQIFFSLVDEYQKSISELRAINNDSIEIIRDLENHNCGCIKTAKFRRVTR